MTIAINTMETSAHRMVRHKTTGTNEDFFGAGFLVIANTLREIHHTMKYKFSSSFNCISCFADAADFRMEMALCMGSTIASRMRGS